MLTRRQLLSRGTTLLMMVPVIPAVLQACSSSSSAGSTPDQSCPSANITTDSSVNDQHSHFLCIPTADITNPPANGMTYTALQNGEHVHTVTLTAAQLAQIGSGGTVTIQSSSDLDPISNVVHPHTFTITKPTASAPPPPPAPSGW